MWLACQRLTRESWCSLLSLLETSLSYPWLMSEESPSYFRLRTFCDHRYCRKNKLDKHNKIWAAILFREKRTSIASMYFVCDPNPSNNSIINHCGFYWIEGSCDTHQQSTQLCQPMPCRSCTCYWSWQWSALNCTCAPPRKHPRRLPYSASPS